MLDDNVLDVIQNGILAAQSWRNTPQTTDRLLSHLATLEKLEGTHRQRCAEILHSQPADTPLSDQLLHHALQTYTHKLYSASSVTEMASSEQIAMQQLQFCLIKPETNHIETLTGEHKWQQPKFEPRLEIIIANLGIRGISYEDISLHVETINENMVRKAPYVLIQIPAYNKSILVCNQVGEATFVISGTYQPMTKSQILKAAGIRIVKQTQEKWIEEIMHELSATASERFKNVTNMQSADYYSQQNVTLDLNNWSAAAGLTDIESLTSNKKVTVVEFVTANGERVKGRTYLNRAGIALGIGSSTREVDAKKSEILKFLKKLVCIKIVEYPEMNRDYLTPRTGAADLQAWVEAANLQSVIQLSTTHTSRRARFTASNGEEVQASTFLNRMGVALGLASGTAQAKSMHSAILTELKRKFLTEWKSQVE